MDTFPSLLLEHARQHSKRPAMRHKRMGVWEVSTWESLCDRVATLAHGLQQRGVGPGTKFGVFGPNSTDLYAAYLAVQSLGGIPVPISSTLYGKSLSQLLESTDVDYVLAHEQQEVDALLECDQGKVREIIYINPRGMQNYSQSSLVSLKTVCNEQATQAGAEFLESQIASRGSDDTAFIIMTSGSSRPERPVELTHSSLIHTARCVTTREKIGSQDELMAYLPISVGGDVLFSFGMTLVSGCSMNCPESDETALLDMQEIGPTVLYAPSYVYKFIVTDASNRIESAEALDNYLYKAALRAMDRVARHWAAGKTGSILDWLRFYFARATTFAPFCNVYGLSRLRLAMSGGDALSREVYWFFRTIGVDLRETYGLVEGSMCVTLSSHEDWNSDSAGVALDDTEIRIQDGEIWFRGPGEMKGYYNDPAATRECIVDGWMHTHDAGFLDEKGRLHVRGQLNRTGTLKNGTQMLPDVVENELRSNSYIKQAIVVGNDRDYLVAVLAIDGDITRTWADRRTLRYAGFADLSTHESVREMVREHVQQVNATLQSKEEFAGMEIRRFALLHREFSVAAGEVTISRKLRGHEVERIHQGLIDALYTDALEYTYTDPMDDQSYVLPLGNV